MNNFSGVKVSETSGVVLVHCLMGMSRSSTLVLAFLMLRRGMGVTDALRHVSTIHC